MEIAPIAGIRITPTLKSRPLDPELTAFFQIEPSARPDEDSYTGSGKKAAGAEDDSEEDEEILDTSQEDTAAGPPVTDPAKSISFFA